MGDIFDYLEWRGDLSADSVPLCEADYLVIGCFSYFPFDDIVPVEMTTMIRVEDAVRRVIELCGPDGDGRIYHLKEDRQLAEKLMECPRFSKLEMTHFVNIIDYEKEEQFAAMTVILPNGEPLVVYRGTDRNLVGWKEDLNMAFNEVVPSQSDALKYLEEVAAAFGGKIRVCGHSKGGNLAMYASAYCCEDVQNRISEIWNLDGPGFLKECGIEPEFEHIAGKIRFYVPQLSVVGMLFESVGEHQVVRSDGKGFWQHSLYTWKLRRGCLLTEPELAKTGRRFNLILKQWLLGLPYEKRARLVEGVYGVVNAAGASRVEDFTTFKTKFNMLISLGKMDDDTKSLLGEAIKIFYQAIKTVSRQEKEQKKLLDTTGKQ